MTAERFDCGKIKSDPSTMEPAELNRMRELVKAEVISPVWVCELWIRHKKGQITTEEREAGDKWIRLVEDHRRHGTDAPPITAKISKLERGYGRIDIDLEALEIAHQRAIQEASEQVCKRWDQAYCAVIDRHNGIAIMRAVNALCLEDQPMEYQRFLLAKEGLKVLARHFGLDKRNKP